MQLIEALCSSENDLLIYPIFVERFLPEVEAECLRICVNRKLDPHIGKQIAHDAFERFRRYKSFKKDEVKHSNQHKAIKTYLMRICVRLFDDHHRKNKQSYVIHKSYFDEIAESIGETIDVKELLKLRDTAELIFSKLNEKERKVVLTDIEYKKFRKYLPDDVTERLVTELRVKKNTIQKIRTRAKMKIIKAIHEINPQK